jgi:hypothetical protein
MPIHAHISELFNASSWPARPLFPAEYNL